MRLIDGYITTRTANVDICFEDKEAYRRNDVICVSPAAALFNICRTPSPGT